MPALCLQTHTLKIFSIKNSDQSQNSKWLINNKNVTNLLAFVTCLKSTKLTKIVHCIKKTTIQIHWWDLVIKKHASITFNLIDA